MLTRLQCLSRTIGTRFALVLITAMLLVLSGPDDAIAQTTFTDVAPLLDGYFDTDADTDFWMSSLAPADFDDDGAFDLAMLGFFVVYNVNAEHRLLVLRNDGVGANGRWNFVAQPLPLGALYSGGSDPAVTMAVRGLIGIDAGEPGLVSPPSPARSSCCQEN